LHCLHYCSQLHLYRRLRRQVQRSMLIYRALVSAFMTATMVNHTAASRTTSDHTKVITTIIAHAENLITETSTTTAVVTIVTITAATIKDTIEAITAATIKDTTEVITEAIQAAITAVTNTAQTLVTRVTTTETKAVMNMVITTIVSNHPSIGK